MELHNSYGSTFKENYPHLAKASSCKIKDIKEDTFYSFVQSSTLQLPIAMPI